MLDFLSSVRSFISNPWFIGAMAMGYVFYFLLYKVLPFAKGFGLNPRLTKYRMSKSSTLSPEQLSLVALSGISTELLQAYWNVLSLGKSGKARAEAFLAEGYGVDTPGSAQKAIEKRLAGQFSSLLPIVFGAAQLDGAKRKDFLREAAGGDHRFYSYLTDAVERLLACMPLLVKKGIVSDLGDIMKYGFVGWEMDQACILVRAAYDMGYITEEEAWCYLEQAQQLARKGLGSWRDFGMSYLIGRVVQMEDGTDGMEAVVLGMLRDRKSPWLSIDW
ncbi:MAG: hypothetical protein CSA07_05550 [Bacteroidia bacterium]|nr:MAG: hypothetical protein CSA07_05550 [Bacteroidia bacterium]